MNEVEMEKLKRRLLQYPDVTDENIDLQVEAYKQREEEKSVLIEGRGFSNAMAESYLDRKGIPRPPGWHSVFFYPGSNRPRNTMLFGLVAIFGVVWFAIS